MPGRARPAGSLSSHLAVYHEELIHFKRTEAPGSQKSALELFVGGRLASEGRSEEASCGGLLCMEGAGSGCKMGGGEGMSGRAGAGAAAAAKEKSGFAATCSLLSRYMKEKKGGALQGLVGLDMAPPAAVVVGGGAFQPPTTMNLLSGLEEPNTAGVELALEKSSVGQLLKAPTDNQDAREDAHQLTIFYGGKVVVVDNFPSTKVNGLLQMANGAGDAGDKAGSSSLVQQSPPQPAHNTLPDLPIARRNSLHRFLEKRKGRIVAKAPYQISSSSAAPSKQANGDNAWLGLGQEVTN
ncbi:protein TIFY 10A [Hordeum vulgare]|nr:protein TIFY 10A [Hordeum vulgare]